MTHSLLLEVCVVLSWVCKHTEVEMLVCFVSPVFFETPGFCDC